MKLLLKKILFSIIITAVFFIVLEVAWRLKVSVSTGNRIFLFYGRSFTEARIKAFINNARVLLYKDKPVPDAISDAEVIWTFGGSTTRCLPLKKEEAWPGRMEYYLREKYHMPVTIVNKATNGATLSFNVDALKNSLLSGETPPDIVIFYQGINDAAEIARYPDMKHKKVKVPFFEILDCRLRDVSLLYASLKEKYCKVVKGDINLAWRAHSNEVVVKDLNRLDEDLTHLTKMAKGFHIMLVLCREPIDSSFLEKRPIWRPIFEEIARLMEKQAHENRSVFIDVHGNIFRSHPDIRRHFLDGVHIDAEGNDIVARYLAECFTDQKLLSKT